MREKICMLSLFLTFTFIFNFTVVYAVEDVYNVENMEIDVFNLIEYRMIGAVMTISVVIVLWIIMGVKLLKTDSKDKVKKIFKMTDSYKEISIDELKKFKINSKKFEMMIYQKFKDIHSALTDQDYNKLKINLTNDLYKSYIEEIEKLKGKKYINVMKDFELVKLKIYDIKNLYGLLHVDVYLNVRMFDYVIDLNNHLVVIGSDTEKMNFEFELTFVKKMDNMNENYVMSKKTCINKMKIEENNE